MSSQSTSYILSVPEIVFLLGAAGGAREGGGGMGGAARRVLESRVLPALRAMPEDPAALERGAVESLIYKRFAARARQGGVTVEPVMAFLAKAALGAERCWVARFREPGSGGGGGAKGGGGAGEGSELYVFQCAGMMLLARPYPLIRGAWRVTPYRDAGALAKGMRKSGIVALSVTEVGGQGEERALGPAEAEGFGWIAGGPGAGQAGGPGARPQEG